MNQSSFDSQIRRFKLVFLGEQSVGKTSLLTRFLFDTFDNNYQPTIGIDFLSKTILYENKAMRLQLWDTAGQERFQALIPAYIRDCAVSVVVYDITNSETFLQTIKWINETRLQRTDQVILILVGNKCELEDKRQVSTKEGEELAEKLNVLFMEISAKTGLNVKLLFRKIAQLLSEKEKTENPESPLKSPPNSIVLNMNAKEWDGGGIFCRTTQNYCWTC